MKKDARRRVNMSALMVALLIMVASSVVHGAPFEYTYTSETLIIVIGELPSEPRVATEFTLRFTYPEELKDGYTQLFTDDPGRSVQSLSATCGDIRFEIYQFDRIQASVTVSGGIPVEWDFTAIQSYNSSDDSSSWLERYFIVFFQSVNPPILPSLPTDTIDAYSWSEQTRDWGIAGSAGTWTVSSVPLPSTLLLLGSGLIPLVWFRRRKQSGE